MSRMLAWLWVALTPLRPKGAYRALPSATRRRSAMLLYSAPLRGESRAFTRAQALHVCGHVERAATVLDTLLTGAETSVHSDALLEHAEIHASNANLALARESAEAALSRAVPERSAAVAASVGLFLLRIGETARGEQVASQAIEALLEPSPEHVSWLSLTTYKYAEYLRTVHRASDADALVSRVRTKHPDLFGPESLFAALSRDAAA